MSATALNQRQHNQGMTEIRDSTLQQPQNNNNSTSTMNRTNNSNNNNDDSSFQSRPGKKRSRGEVAGVSDVPPPMMRRCAKMIMHPVKAINTTSQMIVDGDYDGAISSLTSTLKNIKLVLAGDAKVTLPTATTTESESFDSESKAQDKTMIIDDPNDDNRKDEEDSAVRSAATATSGAADSFEYDFNFSSSPNYSSFLKTSVPVLPEKDCDDRTTTTTERSVCIFINPLIVRGDCFETVALDPRLCEELSCVAIYNLALCHQLKAIALSKTATNTTNTLPFVQQQQKIRDDLGSAKTYLRKALNLYEYSHQIFQKNMLPVRVPTIHCMAQVNNLGQIHHLLGDSKKSHLCNKYLLSVLMYTIDAGKTKTLNSDTNSPTGQSCIGSEQHSLVDGFLAIVQHLIISEDCTAPAA